MESLPLTRTYSFNGTDIAWDAIGRGGPVVLIHGFPWSAQAWRRVVPWLARHHRVYYFDMLGSGASTARSGTDLDPSVQDELLRELFIHWGIEDPYVIGHDFGGLAALRGSLIRGLAYRGLTLIDSVGLLPSGSPFFTHAQNHAEVYASMPPEIHQAVFEAYIQSGSAVGLPQHVVQLYGRCWTGGPGQQAFYDSISMSSTAPITEIQQLLPELATPVHVVWGEADPIIPSERGRTLAEKVGAQSFTAVPDAGHPIMEDAPEALVATLLEHLGQP